MEKLLVKSERPSLLRSCVPAWCVSASRRLPQHSPRSSSERKVGGALETDLNQEGLS